MASVQKFTEKAVLNQLRHNARMIWNPANPDIDHQKSECNYSLAPDRGISAYDYFKQRKSELYCYRREDVKVMAGWVVTAPKGLPPDRQEDFFRAVYQFLSERYGKENCIQAIVHKDESGQPHLHYCFIPVSPDKKHGGEKVCANEVLNRQELRNFHPQLQKYLNEQGIPVKIMTGITAKQGGNRSVKEMKEERKWARTLMPEHTPERGRW